MFKLRKYQSDAVDAVINDMKYDGNSLVVLPTGCHEFDYPILMSDGSLKKVQDIIVGDFVMGVNSIPRKVITLHQGNEEAYEIRTTKGETFRVNENHILHLRNTTTPNKYYRAYENISVKNYLSWTKSRKHLYKLQKSGYDPLFSNGQGEIPYLLGVWLGDGTSRCSQITNPDIEIVNYIKNFCEENNVSYRKLSGNYSHSITTGRWSNKPNIFRETLKKYNLYGNKHIPEIYFQSDRIVRLQLLAGILDSDGHYDQVKGIYDLGLSNERLFDDCLRLIRSLGFFCSKRLRQDCNGKTVFRTTVCGEGQEDIPCLVERKKPRSRKQIKNPMRFGFTVKPIGRMDYYGFSIEGEDQLYIDGQGFIQHNSGKSIIIAEVAQRLDKPILVLQPSKEILEQNIAKLRKYVPFHNTGIYSASFGKKQIRKFTFATIQSVYKKPELFQGFGLVLIDESHTLNPKNLSSMFTSFLKAIGNPKTIGFTASPYRNMIGYHKEANGDLIAGVTLKLINRIKPDFWKKIIFNVNNAELVNQGFLSPLKYYDLSFIRQEDIPLNKSGTEFDLEAFDRKLSAHQQKIIHYIIRCANYYKSVLVFCATVSQAHNFASGLPNAESVDGKTKTDLRDAIIKRFKEGKTKVVFNVGVLTTGFDHPELDCIILLRPTRSLALYYQMLGRGVRIAPGKESCACVDFTNTYKKLGRIETIELVKEKRNLFQKYPMWELKTECGYWHNQLLFSYKVK